MKILFMGTPEFAVPSLAALLAAGHQVVGVVTQPDRPAGRGRQLAPSPVKQLAVAEGLPLFQPKRLRRPEALAELRALGAELTVVVAYGQILSKEALELSPLGAINVHASLLPKFRGAAPIHRAVLAGEAVTGISTMWMDEGMDTGDICLMAELPIDPLENVGSVHDRLARLGATLLVETVAKVAAGVAPRQPQEHAAATLAPKLSRADEVINWSGNVKEVHNQIRGLSPWPGAYTTWVRGQLKILAAEPVAAPVGGAPGTVLEVRRGDGFVVATSGGALLIREVQPQGKGRMGASDFVNGYQIEPGLKFS